MKVLVTGATGFLGRHLIKKLKEKPSEIYISNTTKANLSNVENLYIYNSVKFDYIFHLAAVTKAGDYCVNHPGDQWIQNQTINTNILKYWKEFQPQAKMICMGTSCSYAPGIYMTEENYLLGEPEDSLYTYAMTKRMLLLGLQSIGRQYGLKWLYFIPSTLYGPDFELDDNHFIFDFIRNCYNAKHSGDKFVIWGDGEQRRELVYIQDAIGIMLGLLDKKNQIFNIGAGADYSINEFAEKICSCYGYDYGLVEHDLTKYVGVREKKLNTEKVLNFLNGQDVPRKSIALGLEESIDYFIWEMEKQI